MKTLAIAVLCVLAIPAIWLGSAFAYQSWHTYTHRFRLTLQIDTPEGTKSGSSVIEVKVIEKAFWLPQTGGVIAGARGEAVFVDLGQGRNIVATLGFGPNGSSDLLTELAQKVFWRATGKSHREINYRTLPWLVGTATVPPDLFPTLVTFSDLLRPETARVVRLAEIAHIFGPKTSYHRATMEMNVGALTNEIRARLPWIGDYGAETSFERRLRETGGAGGGSLTPGRNLKRG